MMDDTSDDTFGDRIAEPLRDLERADATFEARAMSAVHATARADARLRMTSPAWWLRPRTLRFTPIASLALAAGFAAIVLGASALLRPGSSERQPAGAIASRPDTVHVVRFVLVDPNARRVALVGAFNQWQKGVTLLKNSGTPGVWTIEVPLESGRHEYAFVVYDQTGERWVADPYAEAVHDEFGTESSVIAVGSTT